MELNPREGQGVSMKPLLLFKTLFTAFQLLRHSQGPANGIEPRIGCQKLRAQNLLSVVTALTG
jgi:hypothetical protein